MAEAVREIRAYHVQGRQSLRELPERGKHGAGAIDLSIPSGDGASHWAGFREYPPHFLYRYAHMTPSSLLSPATWQK